MNSLENLPKKTNVRDRYDGYARATFRPFIYIGICM